MIFALYSQHLKLCRGLYMHCNCIPLPFPFTSFSFGTRCLFFLRSSPFASHSADCSSPCCTAGCVIPLPETCNVLGELIPSHLHLLQHLPLLPQRCQQPAFMLCAATPCQAALLPSTVSHRHLQCHLLPPVMYSTNPFLLVPTALVC